MLTLRGVGLLAAAVLLYASARAFGVPELQLTAVAAVGLVFGAVLYALLASARLTVDRRLRPGDLHQGAATEVELAVRNTGRLPTVGLELHDPLPRGFGAGLRTRLPALSRGGGTTLRGRLTGVRRGRFALGPVELVVRDPFRLVARRHEVSAPGTLTVYPAIAELGAGLPLGGATSSAGTGNARPSSSGEDRSTVREYVHGDDLRGVHWASTAHRGKLMVRQAEAPQEPRAVVLLDARDDRHGPAGPRSSFETAVSAAASVLCHLDRRGRGVTLVDGPLVGPTRSRPAEGWLEHLAVATPSEVDLATVARQLAQGLAGDGALVAVLSSPDASDLERSVRAGRAFSSCAALLIDVAAHHGRRGDGLEPAAQQLRAAGWRVAIVDGPQALPLAWHELVVERPRTTVGR